MDSLPYSGVEPLHPADERSLADPCRIFVFGEAINPLPKTLQEGDYFPVHTGDHYTTLCTQFPPFFFLKLFQKIEMEGKLPNSFYEAIITLIPKPDKYPTKKENYKLMSLMKLDAKFYNNIVADQGH